MSLNSKKVLGIRVTTSKREIILEEVKKWLDERGGKPRVIVTPNPEQVVLAREEKRFADILNRADVVLPDGIGVALALGIPRIAGIDFLEDLVKLAEEWGVTVGLIGGFNGLAVRALECLSREYPGLRGWAADAPLVQLDKLAQLDQFVLEISQKIRKTNTRLVFVGLGAPKQEYFIARLCREMSSFSCHPELDSGSMSKSGGSRVKPGMTEGTIFMSVGGSFDILSGSIQRAPVFIRRVGMEWLWRLVHEPWRFRRQLALLKFGFLVLREKVTMR